MRSMKPLAVLLSLVTGLACGARALAESKATADWPQFRGPGGQGTAGKSKLPVTWSADRNVVWKTELPGPGASSPVLVNDRIFLTCHTGFGQATYYVSRNGRTVVLAAKPEFEQLAQNDLDDRSTFNASPAIAGDRLLLRSDKFLYCIGEK